MTGLRLGILMMPSFSELEWRAAIVNAVKRRGGLFARSPAEFLTAASDQDAVVVIRTVRDALNVRVDEWVVFDASIEDVASTVSRKSATHPLKVYRVVAERLACASWILERGGLLISSAAFEVDLPSLGLLSRSGTAFAPELKPERGPLEIYRSLPPMPGATADWPIEMFIFEDAEKRGTQPPSIDLTGRGRVVVFGPRFDLPAGHWRITGRFSLDVEDSDVYLKFQWGVGEDLESLEIMLQRSGDYEVSLEKSWHIPGPAELRIWASNAHFLGRMEFHGAAVTLVGPAKVSPPEDTKSSDVDAPLGANSGRQALSGLHS